MSIECWKRGSRMPPFRTAFQFASWLRMPKEFLHGRPLGPDELEMLRQQIEEGFDNIAERRPGSGGLTSLPSSDHAAELGPVPVGKHNELVGRRTGRCAPASADAELRSILGARFKRMNRHGRKLFAGWPSAGSLPPLPRPPVRRRWRRVARRPRARRRIGEVRKVQSRAALSATSMRGAQRRIEARIRAIAGTGGKPRTGNCSS
jgi:hypothetical protein